MSRAVQAALDAVGTRGTLASPAGADNAGKGRSRLLGIPSQVNRPVTDGRPPFLAWAVWSLAAVGAVLLVGGVSLHYAGQWPEDLFYADGEANVWTWYCTVLLAVLGSLFGVGALALWAVGRRWWPSTVLALVALYMSLDEAAALHERLSRFGPGTDFHPFAWILPGGIFASVVGLGLLWLARSIAPVLRRRLILSGFLFLLGALGVEIAAGNLLAGFGSGQAMDTAGQAMDTARYHALVLLEEGLELAGTLVALRAVLSWLDVRTVPKGLEIGAATGAHLSGGRVRAGRVVPAAVPTSSG